MADNYLEKKFEQLGKSRTVVHRTNPSLDTLLKRNRSYRGYDNSRVVGTILQREMLQGEML